MKRSSITKEIFVGMTGEISSKRVMMFLSFCMMIIMAIFSTIYSMKVEQFIFDGFLYIVVGGLFSVASEKFSNAFKKVDGEKSETSNS
jgi:nitrate/nitrite transporter NarK